MQTHTDDNDMRAAKIEEFMIKEALHAGVIKAKKKRTFTNPNRWEKQLAPWFTEECRQMKHEYLAK